MRNFANPLALAAAALCALAYPGSAQDLKSDSFVTCYFRPQLESCRTLINGHDGIPAVDSIKDAYEGYARYLQSANQPLTDLDRQFLADNAIELPEGMTALDAAGLHNVINDPALAQDREQRRIAVNRFLRHAIAAELFCDFNVCGA